MMLYMCLALFLLMQRDKINDSDDSLLNVIRRNKYVMNLKLAITVLKSEATVYPHLKGLMKNNR